MALGAKLFEYAGRFIARLAAGAKRMGNDLPFDEPTVGPTSHVADVVHAGRRGRRAIYSCRSVAHMRGLIIA